MASGRRWVRTFLNSKLNTIALQSIVMQAACTPVPAAISLHCAGILTMTKTY